MKTSFQVIVIGGGHAGVEAAWAAANVLGLATDGGASVALVTMDPSKVGVMSCNPAIGGLAKGQIVREVDALNGVMGLATDATGIQFRVLNTSKGAAVRGPRAQCDKHAYAREVQRLLTARPEIAVIAGSVEQTLVRQGAVHGVLVKTPVVSVELVAPAVVLTTGTFMRGLMHTGERQTQGGRYGEEAAVGISAALQDLGFELGRLKTGTPPRLSRASIRWNELEEQWGDPKPSAFSELSTAGGSFSPPMPQIACRVTATNEAIHEHIRANLHRAPMYSGQIDSVGPRYCPSLEDKVVRFAERPSHHVYLEPESLEAAHADWIYCNGISTSLPADVQDFIVRNMPGCEQATILRYGYAVEYDIVKPHQIYSTAETRAVHGLFLAGQINGTSGYEEAAGQGLIAGLNAARRANGEQPITFGRDESYIGVMMDDLVTKSPTEPYRMFTSRAEHRLHLRADNAPDRLTTKAEAWGLLRNGEHAERRRQAFASRQDALSRLQQVIESVRDGEKSLAELLRRPEFTDADLRRYVGSDWPDDVLFTAQTERFYSHYLARSRTEIARSEELERRTLPAAIDYSQVTHLRNEARQALQKFRPTTLGQAARLEGITPADVTLLGVLIKKWREDDRRQREGTPVSSA